MGMAFVTPGTANEAVVVRLLTQVNEVVAITEVLSAQTTESVVCYQALRPLLKQNTRRRPLARWRVQQWRLSTTASHHSSARSCWIVASTQ